ncbi:MAG TPA: hypothetical protein VHE55_13925 [Fimbriimonadaceae bacterium]|nr:hypothetical protein [Fimbriimonadaceae bacterium]
MRLVWVAAFLAVAVAASAQSFVKAQFIFFRTNDGKKEYTPPRQIVLTDKAEIAKLTHFMPGLGLPKSGLPPAKWDAWGIVRLMRPKGPGMQVFFPYDGKFYSVIGKQGDFPAAKGFRDFLLNIEKRAKL